MGGAVINLKGKVKDEELEEGPEGQKDYAGAFVEEELVDTGAEWRALWGACRGWRISGRWLFRCCVGMGMLGEGFYCCLRWCYCWYCVGGEGEYVGLGTGNFLLSLS